MKKFLMKHRTDLIITLVMGAFMSLSWLLGLPLGQTASRNFADSLLEMLQVIPAIFILVGLVEAWVPREVVARHTGAGSSWLSALWMILLAMLQAGPLYGAFPVAWLMWQKGTSPRNIFIYLGAFTTLKLPMLGFEVGFLGLEFTLLRTMFALPVFLVIAGIMDRLFGRDFTMHNGHADPKEAPRGSADPDRE